MGTISDSSSEVDTDDEVDPTFSLEVDPTIRGNFESDPTFRRESDPTCVSVESGPKAESDPTCASVESDPTRKVDPTRGLESDPTRDGVGVDTRKGEVNLNLFTSVEGDIGGGSWTA